MNWLDLISQEKQKLYFKQTLSFLEAEKEQGKIIFPAEEDIFNAFKLTEFDNLKVVILGQDPYHNYNQAHGLAFSVQKGVDIPPSLRNMYKELEASVEGFQTPTHGNLENWAKQGIFLLNTTLTVEAHSANSHKDIGWETFTDSMIQKISKYKQNVVFMLWGAHARKKKSLIDSSKHLVLESSHPSPLSAYRGFLGCGHFVLANDYLQKNNLGEIEWKI
ncbi:UNVERIFIED_CONTAM: hypothetical protein GTU68_014214 [Idotea baltica]|nr:hypothetical protein [Idotea baltica]